MTDEIIGNILKVIGFEWWFYDELFIIFWGFYYYCVDGFYLDYGVAGVNYDESVLGVNGSVI